MKNLLFLLLLIPVLSFGQTANYTSLSSTDLEVYSVSDKTLVYEFYDTLSGNNDTLIISFPKEFAVDYTATLGSTWVSTGTTTDSDVFLQGRNASHETWTDLGTTTFAAETTTAYSDGIDVGGYLYYRLVCVSASGNAHLKNTLVLKKKVGSSGGSASYLVYTAIVTDYDGAGGSISMTVLENTIGAVVWTNDGSNGIIGTLENAFPSGTTFLSQLGSIVGIVGSMHGVNHDFIISGSGGDAIALACDDCGLPVAISGFPTTYQHIEIRVYP